VKLHYDPKVDALYLRLSSAPVAESEEVRPGIVHDLDSAGRLVAVEILNVSKQIPDADVHALRRDVA
jgi:uncharacterized protein YuzE